MEKHSITSSDTKTSMDLPHKMHHPRSNPSSTTKLHQNLHPEPDPTIIPPSTIQNISNHFSRLYTNHKRLASLKPSNGHANLHPHPQVDTYFQAKALPVSDTSCTTLTKSKSQHGRNINVVKEKHQHSTRTKVTEKVNNKKGEMIKKDPNESSYGEYDLKKAAQLMSRSQEKEQTKRNQEGFETKRPSLSSLQMPVNGGRRRSFCSSQTELADFLSCNGVKVVAVDMPPFMQIHAVDCARKTHDSLEKFTSKTLAFTLKKEFDGVYGPAWHCIVGTSFGSFVTHSVGGFIYFSLDHKQYVLLFKTTVQNRLNC